MNVQSLISCDLRHNWRAFADTMFALEDADPGYMLLRRAELPRAQKLRYVLAWCTFYNPGIAALASTKQGAHFYDYLLKWYPVAKRASERRHFRGQAGLKAIHQWMALYPKPEGMIESCYAPTYMGVRQNMRHMAQMGDYFFWKLADVWDTVFGQDVDFTTCERYMPKVPQQGAELIASMEWTDQNWTMSDWVPGEDLRTIMGVITQYIRKRMHPFNKRPLELQEAETVCCVFKQHVHGDYRFGLRSAKAWNRLQEAQSLAETTAEKQAVRKLSLGLTDGGIWKPSTLNALKEYI